MHSFVSAMYYHCINDISYYCCNISILHHINAASYLQCYIISSMLHYHQCYIIINDASYQRYIILTQHYIINTASYHPTCIITTAALHYIVNAALFGQRYIIWWWFSFLFLLFDDFIKFYFGFSLVTRILFRNLTQISLYFKDVNSLSYI